MSRIHFEELRNILRHLNKEEIKVARRVISSHRSSESKKSDQLFTDALNPKLTYETSYKKHFSEMQKRSFDRMILRLKDKVLESVILDVNITRKGAYSDWYRNWVETRKRFIAVFTLWGRGLSQFTMDQFDKLIRTGYDFELYEMMEEVLYWKKMEQGFRDGSNEFENLELELQKIRRCKEAVQRARDHYHTYFAKYVDFTGLNNKKVGFLFKAISEMQDDYRDTGSQNVAFFMYTLTAEYHIVYKEYDQACKVEQKLASLVANSPALYMPRRLAFVYADLANYFMLGHDFRSAQSTIQQCLDLYTTSDTNYSVNLQLKTLIQTHMGDLTTAKRSCNELLAINDFDHSSYRYALRRCTLANIQFLQADFKGSQKTILQCTGFEPDKEGWAFGIRMLSAMAHIETESFDQADAKLTSLREFLNYWKDDIELRRRDKLVLKVMLALMRNSYDFEGTYREQIDAFNKLESADERYGWEIGTHEIVVFHEWFKSKMTGTGYVHGSALRSVQKAFNKVKRKASKELQPV